MNPPLRSEADRQALIHALVDGTADAVATDHAPHSAAEKGQGFVDAPFGVIGLRPPFQRSWSLCMAVPSVPIAPLN